MIHGRALHRLAALVCSAKALERIVEPAIADLQRERRVTGVIAGYAAVLIALATCAFDISDATCDDRRLGRRLVVRVLGVTCAMTLLLVVLALDRWRGWEAAALLVPQALPLAIPIGMACGTAFSVAGQVTVTLAKMILAGAVVASLLSFGIFAWLLPAANQAFRELVFRERVVTASRADGLSPQKGMNEMTLSELQSEKRAAASRGQFRLARSYSRQFHFRFALGTAAFTVAVFLLAFSTDRRMLRGLVAFGACFVYWVLIFVREGATRRGHVAPIVGAWLPNLFFFVLTATIIARSHRTPVTERV